MKLEKYTQKLCCFYASDWHLTVMLLPYINRQIEQKSKVYMECENDIKEKMNTLLGKLDIKNKKNIMNIKWNNEVQEDEENEKEKIYIVSGTEQYITETNKTIEEYYKNKEVKIKIINCYEINRKTNLNDIIEKNGYTQILNTKGENKILDNKFIS